MTARERFKTTMAYGQRDRVPLIDLGFWPECFEAWRPQGLPAHVNGTNTDAYFGMDGFWRCYLSPEATDGHALVDRGMVVREGVRIGLTPMFESKVLEDLGDEEVVQLGDGTRVRRHRRMGSIPTHEGHLLESRSDWETHYLPRLDPNTSDRYPADWSGLDRLAADADREHILILPAGSLYGWIRNWMGVVGVSLLVYDDPVLFEEMIDTITDCICGVLERVLCRGGRFDACLFWEDMSYNKGPLISPAHFKQFLSPRYARITELLRAHGVETIIVDSDGNVEELVPLWLDVGVNCVLPMEIGTTGTDPLEYRRRFGHDLRMIGGVDKRILAQSTDAIDAELDRLRPLIEDGGFIPTCDHKVPPDVPLSHYRHFVEKLRED